MRFAVFTNVMHHRYQGKYFAYSPYVREMNIWLKYVETVEVVAPLMPGGEQGIKYEKSELTFTRVPAFNFKSFSSAVKSFIKIPYIFIQIMAAMNRADHLHLRCPGNLALLAAIAQIFFPKKPKTVKYAGNWDPDAKQPRSYRFQKWILSNTFLSRNIQVLVYGNWPDQSKNVVPFFTASFAEKNRGIIQKDFTPPFKFVFTGNLVEGKGLWEAVNLIEALKEKGEQAELEIYGDGALIEPLNEYIQRKNLQNFVTLKGRKCLEELIQTYKEAHFVVLLSRSEGWPKSIAEGMWYGCIPVATNVSCVPWMLGEGTQGILISSESSVQSSKIVEEENVDKIVANVQSLIENPKELRKISIAAQKWSQEFTLEKFEKYIRKFLHKNHHRTNDEDLNENFHLPRHNRPLRILQLIDSLNPGGAERMALNLANSLVGEVDGSFLSCTREEGMLKDELNDEVGYLFLNKKHALDLQAFRKLRQLVKEKEIDLVHAHGTSWFWGVLLKLSGMRLKLVWHNHTGANVQLNNLRLQFLKISSRFFDGIISVNHDLKSWALRELNSSKVIQLNNFIISSKIKNPCPLLKGSSTDFKIICVANLRPEKDHLNLLAAFERLDIEKVSLHLIGSDPYTDYSKEVKEKILESKKRIYYYGSVPEVSGYLGQADVGVLSSRSEGLPLALLEYGMAGLAVVCTEVGQCKEVTDDLAMLVPPDDPTALGVGIATYYKDNKRQHDAVSLQDRIRKTYSKEEVFPLFLEFYYNLIFR